MSDEIHRQDAVTFALFGNRMKKEIEKSIAFYSWRKGFVQSNYGKHEIDELQAIYTVYVSLLLGTNFSQFILFRLMLCNSFQNSLMNSLSLSEIMILERSNW